MSVSSARRASIDRWIIGLTPLVNLVSASIASLGLGEPRVSVGPSFMGKHLFDAGGDRIRKGAVWWINGMNCGFHVDFLRQGLIIESWTGNKKIRAVHRATEQSSLAHDLRLCLDLSGLAELARTITKARS